MSRSKTGIVPGEDLEHTRQARLYACPMPVLGVDDSDSYSSYSYSDYSDSRSPSAPRKPTDRKPIERKRSRSRSSRSRSRSPKPARRPARGSPDRRPGRGSPDRRPRSRSPEPPPRRSRAEPPKSAVLHIKNLTRNVSAEHLREIFGNFGSVKSVELAIDQSVQLSKGYAYVEFGARDQAELAIKHMDGAEIDSQRAAVNFVGQRPEPPPPPRGRLPPPLPPAAPQATIWRAQPTASPPRPLAAEATRSAPAAPSPAD